MHVSQSIHLSLCQITFPSTISKASPFFGQVSIFGKGARDYGAALDRTIVNDGDCSNQ